MKFSIDIKNKKGSLDADVEKIVEKGMELNEKDWKDKFDTKHTAKKEILELKHKQKLEMEEQNKTKKNWIEKIIEENRKTKELELEYKRQQEEKERIERQKNNKIKTRISVILGVISIIFLAAGFILGSASGNPESGWYSLSVIGMFAGFAIIFIWIFGDNSKKK